MSFTVVPKVEKVAFITYIPDAVPSCRLIYKEEVKTIYANHMAYKHAAVVQLFNANPRETYIDSLDELAYGVVHVRKTIRK